MSIIQCLGTQNSEEVRNLQAIVEYPHIFRYISCNNDQKRDFNELVNQYLNLVAEAPGDTIEAVERQLHAESAPDASVARAPSPEVEVDYDPSTLWALIFASVRDQAGRQSFQQIEPLLHDLRSKCSLRDTSAPEAAGRRKIDSFDTRVQQYNVQGTMRSFTEVQVPGDMNCFYWALAIGIHHLTGNTSDVDASTVRARVLEHALLRNYSNNQSVREDVLDRLRAPNCTAGAAQTEEVALAAATFHVFINLLEQPYPNSDEWFWTQIGGLPSQPKLQLVYHRPSAAFDATGMPQGIGHYNLLLPLKP